MNLNDAYLYKGIQAPLAIPPTHPKDKSLLRPLSELSKPKLSAAGHSFLRRTEYISSDAKARAEATANAARNSARTPSQRARRHTDASKDDPINIIRHIVKGFDLAYPEDIYRGPDSTSNIRGATATVAEVEAWKNPRHPTKPQLQLLDSYTIEPDLEAFPDSGSYMITKFSGNPTNQTDAHDTRLDVGLIFPIEKSTGDYSYEVYLPQKSEDVYNIQRQFDVSDPDRDNPALCSIPDKEGVPSNRYEFHRTYELQRQQISIDQPYREVALTLRHEDGRQPTENVAHYYPIGTKMSLKPRRNKALAQLGLATQKTEEAVEKPDAWDLIVRDPDEAETAQRAKHVSELEAE